MASHHILVVDDDPLVADSIRRMLVFDGHQVTTAPNAEEALAVFAKGTFELTMLDYEMPGMNGDRLATAIKALAPTQPIVMFTGYAEALGAKAAGRAVDLILGKPFGLEQLRLTVAKLLPGP